MQSNFFGSKYSDGNKTKRRIVYESLYVTTLTSIKETYVKKYDTEIGEIKNRQVSC